MLLSFKQFLFRKFRDSQIRRHQLRYLFWECTTRCNLHCLHCGSDCFKDSATPDMDFAHFLRAVDTIPHIPKRFTVVFTGGEPLLRNDLEACGRALRERGMGWSMVSNGYLYDKERHNALLNAGMGALTFSLDGLEANHNWLRDNPHSFEKVMQAIDLAVSAPYLNFDVVTCVNQKNFSQLEQIRDLLIAKKVKAWRLFTIIPIGRAAQNPLLSLRNEQLRTLMDFIVTSRKQGLIDIKFSCQGYVGTYETRVRDGFFFCRAGVHIASVLSDGAISACPNIDRSFAQGSIYTDNFFHIWQTRFVPFRNREWARVGSCAHCREFKNCLGNGMHNWHGSHDRVLVCDCAALSNSKK